MEVQSLQGAGQFNHSVVEGPQVPAALLATHLHGERLDIDHGYPLRPHDIHRHPLIVRRGEAPPSRALLQQNFGGNLTILIGIVAAISLLPYAAELARERSRPLPSEGSSESPAPGASD